MVYKEIGTLKLYMKEKTLAMQEAFYSTPHSKFAMFVINESTLGLTEY